MFSFLAMKLMCFYGSKIKYNFYKGYPKEQLRKTHWPVWTLGLTAYLLFEYTFVPTVPVLFSVCHLKGLSNWEDV